MKNVLITGGCGFIGSHLVSYITDKTDWNIIIIDKLTYASSGFDRLIEFGILNFSRIKIFTIDLCEEISYGIQKEIGLKIDYIIHLAAETHVDNSIKNPIYTIKNNIMSTVNILEFSRKIECLEKFIYFSTDEVYGSAPDSISYSEEEKHKPTNPYSASKSSSEQICKSYENTYGIPLIIVNSMNAYGEMQHVEKFIPKCIKQILNDEIIIIHSDPECKIPGSRSYIHANNISDAVVFLIRHGEIGNSYHIPGEKEVTNLDMAIIISQIIGKKLHYSMANFHQDRPGHDLRYSLNGDKILKLGWKQPKFFDNYIKTTVEWTLQNMKWLEE